MRTLLISTLAVGLIGCASSPQVVRIVDPYSYSVYELTNVPCPRSGTYPLVFAYHGTIQGCYRVSEARQGVYLISALDWRTEVFYSFSQLSNAKDQYVAMSNQVILSNRPTYQYTAPYQPETSSSFPRAQCFGNGFGTVTCN